MSTMYAFIDTATHSVQSVFLYDTVPVQGTDYTASQTAVSMPANADVVAGDTVDPNTAAITKGVPISIQNANTLKSRAAQALTANSTYLALVSPTNAQNTAQVQRLTKENNALIRLMLGRLDTITDT